MKKLAWLFFLVASSLAAQGIIVAPKTVLGTLNGVTRPISSATITVCAAGATGLPCSPALTNTVFTDAGLTVSKTNPFTTDSNGNYQFAIAPGVYTVTETGTGFAGYSYQLSVTCILGQTCLAPLSANLVFSGNNTHSGTETFTGAVTLGSTTATSVSTGTLAVTGSTVTTLPGGILANSINTAAYVGGNISATDIGGQINAAYSALPTNGGVIFILPPTSGNTYNFATPIVLATTGKEVALIGLTSGSEPIQLNYTPTSASTAIQMDFTGASGDAIAVKSGIYNLTLDNNNCFSSGCVSGSATGLVLGPVGGAAFARFENFRIAGFPTGASVTVAASWGTVWENCSISGNTTGFSSLLAVENTTFHGCKFTNDGTALAIGSGDVYLSSTSIDQPQTVGINQTGGNVFCAQCHFEGQSGTGTPMQFWTSTAGYSMIQGGFALDDVATGNLTNWFQFGGESFSIDGLIVSSPGRTATQVVQAISPTVGWMRIVNHSGGQLTNLLGGANSAFVTNLSRNTNSANAFSPLIFEASLQPGKTTFANIGTPANGLIIYCSDCTIANPCAGSGTGAIAKRLNGVWVCN